MVSTEADAADEERAYACGATVYLHKPVTPETLAALAGAYATVPT